MDLPTPESDTSLDLLLEWERGKEEHQEQGDAFVGDCQPEGFVVSGTAAPAGGGQGGSFEWSEERALAIEAALARLGPLPAARIIRTLGELIHQPANSPDREQRLDEVEDWLLLQLPAWQSPVRVDGKATVEGELAEIFNEGMSAGANGLNLALEVVDLLRQAESHHVLVAEQLLEQVDEFFQQARQRLLESEPFEDEE